MIPGAAAQSTSITLRLRRRFAAPRVNVFRAWTDPEVLKRWWCPDGWVLTTLKIDLRPTGGYRIGMRRIHRGPDVFVYGSFLEVHPPEKLVYTWRWENAFEQMPESRVTVQFLESGGTTEVVLIHEALPEIGVCVRHRSGWIATFQRMDLSLAGFGPPTS